MKILNWIGGGFFRTLGRFIAFIVLGAIFSILISKSNIKFTDLLGIETVHAESISDQDFLNSFLNDCSYYIDGGTSVSNTTCGWNNNFRTATIDTNNISGQGTIHFKSTNFNTTRQLLVPGTTNTWLNPSKVQFQVRVDYQLFPLDEIYIENNPDPGASYYAANIFDNGISFNFFPVYSSIESETGGGGGLCEVNHGNNDGRYKYYTITCNIPSKAYGISDLRMSYYYTRTTTQSYQTTLDVGISTNVNWLFTGILQAQMYASENNQTQSIIQAQENATQQQIESQQVCTHIDKNKIIKNGIYFNYNGEEIENPNYGITDYINVLNAKMQITNVLATTGRYMCFYNTNKVKISCEQVASYNLNDYITIPINANYVRISIQNISDKPQFELCQNGNQALNNYLTDNNMSETNSTASSFFNNFTDNDHGGLSSIITAPLNTINAMLSNTCVAPSATWKGAVITLPCGDMFWNRPGADQLKNLLNVFYGGFVCYYAIRRLFLLIEQLKDPTNDRIEVADL